MSDAPMPRPVLSPGMKALFKRAADMLTVYGHGLLAFGVGKMFTGQIDLGAVAAMSLGVATHGLACYLSWYMET